MFVRRDFETWVRKQFMVQRAEGRCTRLLLRHVTQGNKAGNEVASINLPPEYDEQTVQEVANEIETSAHTDAGGLGGPQKYMVFAFFEKSEAKPLARFPFLEHASDVGDSDEGDELDTESPNAKGLTAQLMRHNEALMRTTMMGITQIIGTLQRQTAKQAETIEKLVEEKFQNLDLVEELLGRKQERDIAAQEADTKRKLITDAGEKALALLPVIVNKMAGKEVMAAPSMNDEMLRSFLATITPEQMEGLSKVLKPEQAMIVMELYQKMMNPPPEVGGGDALPSPDSR